MNFDKKNVDIAWCPGCGDFLILRALKAAFEELGLSNQELVLVSGIGQAAKTPQYIKANFFNGLHGRAIPAAIAIKLANKNLKVVVTSGDGDIYGEGGNHFIHAIRRNPDITVIAFNNMVYGLTKGQASPTASESYITKINPHGVFSEPFNPLAVAISLNASFVARVFCQDIEKTKAIIKEAIQFEGFSFVDVFQPCVSFNKINTYQWFKENTYYFDETEITSRVDAFAKAIETSKLPLGVFFRNKRMTLEQSESNRDKLKEPLYRHNLNRSAEISNFLDKYK